MIQQLCFSISQISRTYWSSFSAWWCWCNRTMFIYNCAAWKHW